MMSAKLLAMAYCVGIGTTALGALANSIWGDESWIGKKDLVMLGDDETMDSLRALTDQDKSLWGKILCSKIGKDMYLFAVREIMRG